MARLSLFTLTAIAFVLTGCAPPVRDHVTSEQVSKRKPNAPVLARKKNGRYQVAAPWTVALNGHEWYVQKGYVCNGITGPDSIRKTLGDGVNDRETWAAVFHDWLYTRPGMTRARADRLFYDLLLAYGVPSVKARLMYSGVSAYSASKSTR